ncbi:bifunctional (p)ppGpp synthetase/guanosine-3',5'-bis(diphosphate) 3'-pyrophosphohydrolase [Candidatus Gottesmanbacteria bacterium]|nr:bifunctional (p)ppGpp synthetase/guanosine-3',5'-bis(diphosphate) 3'-pyrophosphohydrolase [Candidatus Gottesmanbacteria bacterium]
MPIRIMGARLESQLESYIPPDDLDELARSIQPYMGDRQDQHGKIPWSESVDPRYGLFPIEIKHLSDLSAACSYMDTAAKNLVKKAAVLSVIAMQNLYRNSTHPYFDHVASGCLEMVRDYQPEETTVASSILHDTYEENRDFWETYIENAMPKEVVETVKDLSKFKGRKQREVIVDEQARRNIIGALLDNPRVPFIKIKGDRVHNMRTVHHIGDPRRRRAIINETQQMYMPLAGLLGLKDEEKDLDDLCLRQLGKEYANFSDAVSAEIDKFFNSQVQPDTVLTEVGEIKNLILGGVLELHPRLPTAHDIYRRMGKIKTVLTPSDYYLNIDAVLTRFSQEVLPAEWGREALEILNILIFNGFNVDESFNPRAFQDELDQGLTDSLTVDLVRVSDGLNIHLTIYPQLAYDLEEATIADMYYHRPPKSLEEETLSALEGDEVAKRHLKGMIKARYLRERYEREKGTSLGSYGLVHRLELRLPVGQIRVVGKDDGGHLKSWQIAQGATVMDYAKSIFPDPDDWPKVIAAEVKKGDRMVSVPFDYILSAGETVHIVRGKKGRTRWDPFWIHSFRTDTEGKERTRAVVKATLEREKLKGRYDMKNRVIEVGRQMIERHFDPLNQPLRIDVSYVASVIEECCQDTKVSEFEFKVGMGEIDDERVRIVAQALEPINRKVGVFRVNFATDYPGQTEAVAEVLRRKEISALGSTSGRVSEKGASFVEVYIDPQTLEIHGKDSIIQQLLRDETCRKLAMNTLTFTSSGKTEIFPVGRQRRK